MAISEAAGLKTSQEVGIPNVNTDAFSDGLTSINISGFTGSVLGFSGSLPWDRGEKTYLGTGILALLPACGVSLPAFVINRASRSD